MVFLQPNDGFGTFHVGGHVDADAIYGVLQDAVDEKGHICHKYTDPVRVRSLSNCPLQDVRLVDSFEKSIKVSTIRYQRRLFGYRPQQLQESSSSNGTASGAVAVSS